MYEHGKVLLKIMGLALGGKPKTRQKNLQNNIKKWQEQNQGPFALLEQINLDHLFMPENLL